MIANILDRSALAAKRIVRQLPGGALDLLFPLNRLGCQQEDRVLCASCIEALPELNPPYCAVCAQPNAPATCHMCLESPPAFDGVRAPYQMEEIIQDAIHSLKYRGLKAAAPELARYLAEHHISVNIFIPVPVSVPLHPHRLSSKG